MLRKILIAVGFISLASCEPAPQAIQTEKYITQLTFPVKLEDASKIEFLEKFYALKEDENTRRFLADELRVTFDSNNKPSHQLHPSTFEVYELGLKIIDNNPELAELYMYVLRQEIVAMSHSGQIIGMINRMAEKLGRAYIYGAVNEPMQFIMEGLDTNDIKVLKDVLNINDVTNSHIDKLKKRFIVSEEDYDEMKVKGLITEKIYLHEVFLHTLVLDIRLGLHQLRTRFNVEAFEAARMTKARLRIEFEQEQDDRRKRLDRLVEMANSLN